MSAAPQRQLRLVDTATGEVVEPDERMAQLEDEVHSLTDQLAGAERDIKAWRLRYADLKRDVEREAREHANWPKVLEVFRYWQKVCNHPKSQFTAARFWLAEPFFTKDGPTLCERAIDGAAFDPFITTRKNGTPKRHDGWELIFRNRDKFEEFVNRAPV